MIAVPGKIEFIPETPASTMTAAPNHMMIGIDRDLSIKLGFKNSTM